MLKFWDTNIIFLIPLRFQILYHTILSCFGVLTLFCRDTTLENIFHLQRPLFQVSNSLLNLTIGVSFSFPHYLISFPLGSPRIPPLCRISPSLKRGDRLSKVTVSRLSCICPTIMDWVEIFPTDNLHDNILASLARSIFNPLLSHNETLERYTKSLPYFSW
jgi:hypothetical protein